MSAANTSPRLCRRRWWSAFIASAFRPIANRARKARTLVAVDERFDRTFSAFAHTELEYVLRNLRVQTVVVTGTFTNVCVDSTVRDAYFNGFYPVIPLDLSATPDPQTHGLTLETLGQFFGVVVPSKDILDVWARPNSTRAS